MKFLVILLVVHSVLSTDDGADGGNGSDNGSGNEIDNKCGYLNETENEEWVLIKTPVGVVNCSREVTTAGTKVLCCRHIKYAVVPERFGCPQAVPEDTSEIPINQDTSPICYQANNNFESSNPEDGQEAEDCLYMNICVPESSGDELLQIMFYIHGSAFEFGYGDRGHSTLLDKGAIVVTFNYRLSLFGFLSTGTCDCPGNGGVKDALAALRWVHNNILCFGGDNKNITVIGLSAGAAMASLFPTIPEACKLFSKLILESGSFNADWAWSTLEQAIGKAKKLGGRCGCDTSDPQKLCSCLKSLPASTLLKHTKDLMTLEDIMALSPIPFRLTSENPKCKNTVMTQSPQDLLLTAKICAKNIIIGAVQAEGTMFTGLIKQFENILTPLTTFISKMTPSCLSLTNNVLCIGHITKEMLAYFVKNALTLKVDIIIKIVTSVLFDVPFSIFATLMESAGCLVNFYSFDYLGPCGSSKSLNPEITSTTHGEQYSYIFPSNKTNECRALHQSEEEDNKITDLLTSLYTNAASFLPKWQGGKNYCSVGSVLEDKNDYKKSDLDFWKSLFNKCFFDIWDIFNPNSKKCCSTCPKDYSP